MMDLFPKFIVENDDIILGKVSYHKILANDLIYVKSGGWYRYKKETNTLIFYGASDQFGKATLEEVKNAIDNGKVYSKNRYRDMKRRHNFAYDTGTEIIELWDLSDYSLD